MSNSQSQVDADCELSTAGREKRSCRVTLMGAAGVGKTSIVSRFLHETCPSLYKPTVEELYRQHYYQEDGSSFALDILDTSGGYALPGMRRLGIAMSDAFVLVYAVNDRASFEEVERLRQQIVDQRKDEWTPIVVVGNKCDLSEERSVVERVIIDCSVTIDWNNGYVETSAKDNVNICKIFEELMVQAKLNVNLKSTLTPNPSDVGHKHDAGYLRKKQCNMM